MRIPSMFDAIARRYDLANNVISLGLHKFWKKKALRESSRYIKGGNVRMLDIACGTGDLLQLAERYIPRLNLKVGLDPSLNMLALACAERGENLLVKGKAERLPFFPEIFDLITVSFGVRNFENRRRAFEEIRRILKVGGILTVLEFSKPEGKGLVQKIGWFYTRKLVPPLGGLISGNREAYDYLVGSIEAFPTPRGLVEEVEKVGFRTLKVERLFPPITVLYIFEKPTP
jgi:demethylmenaquinone methyltransferase/2-methoxy-6-polyprenyl-1,4-benzoquinol methylase